MCISISIWQPSLIQSAFQNCKNKRMYLMHRRDKGWPSPGRLIAWIITLGAIGGGAFIVFGLGISFGNDRQYQWMTAIIFSFFTSLFFTQPLQVNILMNWNSKLPHYLYISDFIHAYSNTWDKISSSWFSLPYRRDWCLRSEMLMPSLHLLMKNHQRYIMILMIQQ